MKIKKNILYILLLVALLSFFSSTVWAQTITVPPDSITVTAPATPVETLNTPPSNALIPDVPVPSYSNSNSNSNSTAPVLPPAYSSATSTASASATQGCTSAGIGKTICQIQQLLNSIIPLLVSLGVVYFVWNVVRFVIADGEEAKKVGKDHMIYGIIGFAVIIGMWGLVNIVVNTFGLSGTAAPKLDTIAPVAGCGALSSTSTLQNVMCYITGLINNSVIPLIFALATVMFVWGVVNFLIINSGDEKKRTEGKQFMIWGVIALTVMLSVWGLVGILGSTFGLTVSALPQVCPPGTNCSGK